MPRQPPAAKLRETEGPAGVAAARVASVMRSQPHVPPVRSGAARCSIGPVRFGREWAGAFGRSPLVPTMVTGAAVGASDHRLIVASMVSRRCTQAISDLACGSGAHRIRTAPLAGGRSMHTGGPRQPHPHLLAHVFQMTGFTWEHLGSREDFGYRDAQKTPRSPDPPEHGHHKTLVPHGTHRHLPRLRMTSQDHHGRYPARACLTAPGAARGQPH